MINWRTVTIFPVLLWGKNSRFELKTRSQNKDFPAKIMKEESGVCFLVLWQVFLSLLPMCEKVYVKLKIKL